MEQVYTDRPTLNTVPTPFGNPECEDESFHPHATGVARGYQRGSPSVKGPLCLGLDPALNKLCRSFDVI